MAGSGPAPNPASRRQAGQQAHTWTDLPAEGYQGDTPEWPISAATLQEEAMWIRYWRKPQALMWARMGMVDEVAIYVRSFLAGADGDTKSVTEARQWTIPLGLTPDSMLKNRWRIRADEVGEKRNESKPKKKRALVAVDDAVARA